MSANGYLQLVFYVVVLIALAKPLGAYMARIYEGQPGCPEPLGAPLERLIYRLCGVDPEQEMRWTQYALATLWFSLLGVLAVYALQRLQAVLPLNPQNLAGGVARFFVQYGDQLRHEHQLAGLWRRIDDELPDPDARAHGAEFPFGGDRHGGADRADPRLRPSDRADHRQFLGGPDAHHALHPAAIVARARARAGEPGRGRRPSPPITPCRSSNRSSTTTRNSMRPASRSRMRRAIR